MTHIWDCEKVEMKFFESLISTLPFQDVSLTFGCVIFLSRLTFSWLTATWKVVVRWLRQEKQERQTHKWKEALSRKEVAQRKSLWRMKKQSNLWQGFGKTHCLLFSANKKVWVAGQHIQNCYCSWCVFWFYIGLIPSFNNMGKLCLFCMELK